ncbi:pyridoxal-phosphate dependent enzyme [Actinocrispum sp. NPDC049592]|uniref:threonine ammonia-lyase n=1 Tax=Actinocrispum sp. NPDC049592 TaxID=3154835 RepID=UPI0034482FAE
MLSLHTDSPPLARADVLAAARGLAGTLVRTPVLHSAGIDRLAGREVWLKAENLQRAGSYKLRGALRAVGRVAGERSFPGVVAQSTGNHGIAVAVAANQFGLPATVVLPEDAPATKLAAIRQAGAEVVLAGTTLADRVGRVAEIRARTGYAVVDAYDNPDVISGQGTATLELIEEVPRLRSVVIPVGGGGGIAGACLATMDTGIQVYGVEPVGCDSLTRSLARGERTPVAPCTTLADGLKPSTVGELPFAIGRRHITEMITVDDDEIAGALRSALFHAKVLLEPSAAAGLAGVLKHAVPGPVGVVLTGGNVDPAVLAGIMNGDK